MDSHAQLQLSKIAPSVLTILRKRRLSDTEIAAMSPNQAFKEVCQWHGVRLDALLIEALDTLRAAAQHQRPAANDANAKSA
ncbi:hypothetical protein LPN04_30940 [Rugamonas sp. A1-17]|nr:hypothetical protein [Rugamonas sp. A1-17]